MYSRFSVNVAKAARATSRDWSGERCDHVHGEGDDFRVLEMMERFLGLIRGYNEGVGLGMGM